MRGDRQVISFDYQVVDGSHGQVELHRLPIRAVVEADVHPALGAGVEQVLELRIHANGMYVIVFRNAVHQRGPGFSEIGRLENIWREVVRLVALDGNVGGACVCGRGFDHADGAPLGHSFGRHIVPALAAILGDVNQTIVAAGPDQVFLGGTLHYRKDGVVHLDTGVVFGNGASGRLLLGFVVAREVGGNHAPAHTLIGGLEKNFPSVIKSVRIVSREHDRFGPLETVLQISHPPADHVARPRIDRLRLLGVMIVAGNVSAIRTGINDLGVLGIGSDIAAFTAADLVKVALIDAAAGTRRGNRDRGIILLRSVQPVGKSVVGSDVVELRRWLVVERGPTGAAVGGNGCPAVVAVDQTPRIVGINPEAMVITMRRVDGVESLSAIDRSVRACVQDVNHIGILGIGEHVCVIPGALTVTPILIDEFPFLAPVI